MPTNRESILANVGTTLNTISIDNGYDTDVLQVLNEFRTHDEIDPTLLATLCYYPSKTPGPPPVYYPFNSREEYLDIEIDGHVLVPASGNPVADQTLATQLISQLENDVSRAMAVDPNRGGWAVETLKVSPALTDEGVPDKSGTKSGWAGFVLTFRVEYYPND